MAHIDYFCAAISPYVYLCGDRPGQIAARHGATITYRPVDAVAVMTRVGGVSPRDRHPARQAYDTQDLLRRAARLGMPLLAQPPFFPTNPAPAAYALIAVQDAGGDAGAFLAAITAACWAQGRDVSDDDVIRDCLTAAGCDPALADRGLLAGAEGFHRNTEEAVRTGVFGVPFFVTDTDQRFWGEDRLDDLDAYLAGKLS